MVCGSRAGRRIAFPEPALKSHPGAIATRRCRALFRDAPFRYHEGTVIVEFIGESNSSSVAELREFINDNNLQDQRVDILGGSNATRTIKSIPCREILEPGTDELGNMHVDVDFDEASKGYRRYEGVVYRLPQNASVRCPFPIFVKKISLTR